MKRLYALFLLLGALSIVACEEPLHRSSSQVDVTRVDHSEVKRQAIGNCWLYAQATWLESMLKHTDSYETNVSETYWTYWDLYEKIMNGAKLDDAGEVPTGGSWQRSTYLIQNYGWVRENDVQALDQTPEKMSQMQACAVRELKKALAEGGVLADSHLRNDQLVRDALDQAFSCQGAYPFDMNSIRQEKVVTAEETKLVDPATNQELPLSEWLQRWREYSNPANGLSTAKQGKKLPTEVERNAWRRLEQRIKRALNDHQPVVLSFFVSFNAPNDDGVFNFYTLAERGDLGRTGGHMLVLHDYTVRNAPERGELGEGDLSPEDKALALQGDLDLLVAKNSWGANRWDRPWIGNGYSRITWDYLMGRYYDERDKVFRPFLQSVVLPPQY
jgi:hypothetical protein